MEERKGRVGKVGGINNRKRESLLGRFRLLGLTTVSGDEFGQLASFIADLLKFVVDLSSRAPVSQRHGQMKAFIHTNIETCEGEGGEATKKEVAFHETSRTEFRKQMRSG